MVAAAPLSFVFAAVIAFFILWSIWLAHVLITAKSHGKTFAHFVKSEQYALLLKEHTD
jgi:hypothetical protein